MFNINNDSVSDEGVMIDSDLDSISNINDISQAHAAVQTVDEDLKGIIENASILSAQLASVQVDLEIMRKEIEEKNKIIQTQAVELLYHNKDKARRDADAKAEEERLADAIRMVERLGL